METKKIVGVGLVLVLVLNLLLRAMGKINDYMFWGIIVVIFLISYRFFKKV